MENLIFCTLKKCDMHLGLQIPSPIILNINQIVKKKFFFILAPKNELFNFQNSHMVYNFLIK
jgi:hypothetical protein